MINVIFDIFQIKNGSAPVMKRSMQKRRVELSEEEIDILDNFAFSLREKYKSMPSHERKRVMNMYDEYVVVDPNVALGLLESEIQKYEPAKMDDVDDIFKNLSVAKTLKKQKRPGMYYENLRKKEALRQQELRKNEDLVNAMSNMSVNKANNADNIIDRFAQVSVEG